MDRDGNENDLWFQDVVKGIGFIDYSKGTVVFQMHPELVLSRTDIGAKILRQLFGILFTLAGSKMYHKVDNEQNYQQQNSSDKDKLNKPKLSGSRGFGRCRGFKQRDFSRIRLCTG